MEWISVNDRLPKFGENVFVYGESKLNICKLISKIETIEGINTEWEESLFPKSIGVLAVTHWMPLPKPPKNG